nr:MAG TPA: hypothetical protein [Caudoviricetes sp.]
MPSNVNVFIIFPFQLSTNSLLLQSVQLGDNRITYHFANV